MTVKAGEDGNADDESETLTHTASGGDYVNVTRDLPVTVEDNDTAAVVLTPDSITVAEGDTTGTSYTVKLSHTPSAAVTVTITGHAGTDLTLSGEELTFTTSDWGTAQTVTVKAAHDENGVSESIKLTHTASGGGYSTAADLTVTVTDDDTAAIVLSPTSLTVTEGDTNGASYTVKLTTEPSATVTVTIGGHSGTDLTLSGDTLNSNQLTFTTSNWGTAQTVTVKAGDDDNASNESHSLTHTAAGGGYASVSKSLPVTVTDDAPDTVTVSFGAAAYTVVEGSSRTVTVSLGADPERTVIIPIETNNDGGASDSDYSGVPENVTFASGETEKTFDISATQDNLNESGEKVKLTFGTLPSDATAGTPAETTVSIHDKTQGQDLPTPPTVHFENSSYSVDEGDSVSIKVILSKAPGSEVDIPIGAMNLGGAVTGDDYTVPTSVTFAAADTEKAITLVTTEDTEDDDGESVKLSFGTLPGGITATTDKADETTVSITDDDLPAALTVSFGQAAYTVAESDDATTMDVTENEVAVTVTLSEDPETTLVIPSPGPTRTGPRPGTTPCPPA